MVVRKDMGSMSANLPYVRTGSASSTALRLYLFLTVINNSVSCQLYLNKTREKISSKTNK